MSTDPIDLSTTDGQLLARFAQSGEQWPFEVLVRRHGSLVLGVCRTVLGGAGALHDAEDAAQATFLTLARKCQSLGGYDSIAGWLYRVAWHIAKRTRSARELRSRRECDAATQRGAHLSKVEQQGSADDGPPLLEALHDELNKLPEKYRLPLILHHLEGWTEPEIAELLGCRVGTLSGRLSRGRQMLRERIGRHGKHLAVIGAAALGTALTQQARATMLSAAMQQHLAAPAAGVGAGVSAQAATLSQGALDMLARKLVIAVTAYASSAAVVILSAALIVRATTGSPKPSPAVHGGAVVMANPADPTGDLLPRRAPRAHPSSTRMGGKAIDQMTTSFTGEVGGKVVGPDGQPVPGATIRIFASRSAFDRGEKELLSVTTDDRGTFTLPDIPAGTDLFLDCVTTKPELLSGQLTVGEVVENQRTDLDPVRLHKVQK